MRSETDILNGKVPGFETVTFGGVDYALREPGLNVFAEIVDSVLDLQGIEGKKSTDREAFKKTYDTALAVLKLWDGEIGENIDVILDSASPSELMQFFAKAAQMVTVPLSNLPKALGAPTPARQNRAARRGAKKSGR